MHIVKYCILSILLQFKKVTDCNIQKKFILHKEKTVRTLHCSKNNQDLRIKTESVPDVPDATVYAPTGQAQYLCRDSDFFWDSV